MKEQFQFTPLREGRLADRHRRALHPQAFQFTPLREGRRPARSSFSRIASISIHAPPRGATGGSKCRKHGRQISIHAPPRGATHAAGAVGSPPAISIHAPPRGATRRRHACAQVLPISIHAPPRGATSRTRWLSAGTSYFNSRPSARGDRDVLHRDAWRCLFQFTPLREGRPRCAGTAARPTIFQFTPLREGRRRVAGHRKVSNQISIHAPPRGATIDSTASIEALAFQFTPLREGRRAEKPQTHRLPISIHAPPRGATYGCGQGGCFRCISIHAPPRGATRPPSRRTAQSDYFNSRPSARGDARKG